MVSPMRPLVPSLRLLGLILGHNYDLKALKESGGVIFQAGCFEKTYYFVIFTLFNFFFMGGLFSTILAYDVKFSEILELLQSSMITTVDFFCFEFMFSVNFMLNMVIMTICNRGAGDITNLFQEMERLNISINEEQLAKVARHSKIFLWTFCSMGFVACIPMAILVFNLFPERVPFYFPCILSVFQILLFYIVLTSPIHQSVQLICGHSLKVISLHIQTWNDMTFYTRSLENATKDYRMISKNDDDVVDKSISEIIAIGFGLQSILEKADKALGGILFFAIGSTTMNLAINAYFIFTLYVVFIKFTWEVLIFVFSNALFGIIAIGHIGNLTVAGQSLTNSLSRSKRELQKLQMTFYRRMSEEDRFSLSCLIDQMSRPEGPIYPLCGFTLGFSTTLSLIGLLITYTVILMQFKLSSA